MSPSPTDKRFFFGAGWLAGVFCYVTYLCEGMSGKEFLAFRDMVNTVQGILMLRQKGSLGE